MVPGASDERAASAQPGAVGHGSVAEVGEQAQPLLWDTSWRSWGPGGGGTAGQGHPFTAGPPALPHTPGPRIPDRERHTHGLGWWVCSRRHITAQCVSSSGPGGTRAPVLWAGNPGLHGASELWGEQRGGVGGLHRGSEPTGHSHSLLSCLRPSSLWPVRTQVRRERCAGGPHPLSVGRGTGTPVSPPVWGCGETQASPQKTTNGAQARWLESWGRSRPRKAAHGDPPRPQGRGQPPGRWLGAGAGAAAGTRPRSPASAAVSSVTELLP